MTTIGIRREDKSKWEKRVTMIPADLRDLHKEHGIKFAVQPSTIRAFSDADYSACDIPLAENLSHCGLVMGVKEMPMDFFRPGGAYMFFSHTIKGQSHNMPMLRHLVEQGCTLIDFERIVDEQNRRLVFFGRYAGLAGMIDTLHTYGQRMQWEGKITPFVELKMASDYADLDAAKEAVSAVGRRIAAGDLHPDLNPLVVGFAGYGQVSRGAQEIFDLLPHRSVTPEELHNLSARETSSCELIKVVFEERHTVRPIDPDTPFDKLDFFANPGRYEATFFPYLKELTILVNCIFWSAGSPRLLSREQCRKLWGDGNTPKLRVIGDISCDLEGGIECTLKSTQPDNPFFVYDVTTDQVIDGAQGHGPVIMAVDNLPCELPAASSTAFSASLKPFIPGMAEANWSGAFAQSRLPEPIRRAVILWRGEFTPEYEYMRGFLGA